MSKRKIRVFSREFKLSAVRRMIAGEMIAGENVSALSRVYNWGQCIIGVRVDFSSCSFSKLSPCEGKIDSDPNSEIDSDPNSAIPTLQFC